MSDKSNHKVVSDGNKTKAPRKLKLLKCNHRILIYANKRQSSYNNY